MLNGFCGAGFFALLEKMERHKQKEKGEEAFLDLDRNVIEMLGRRKARSKCFGRYHFRKQIIGRKEQAEPHGNQRHVEPA